MGVHVLVVTFQMDRQIVKVPVSHLAACQTCISLGREATIHVLAYLSFVVSANIPGVLNRI